MARYQILYWYDIPLQVKAKDETGRYSVPLPPRFQRAIDEAAMAAGLTGTDHYLDGFRWSKARRQEGSAEAVVEAVVAELVDEYDVVNWRKTVVSITGKG